MASPSIIVCGPQGCGKTHFRAEIARHFGAALIVDGWMPGDPVVPHAVHLTFATMEAAYLDVLSGPGGPMAQVRDFFSVALEAGLPARMLADMAGKD